MNYHFLFFPAQATAMAPKVDALFWALVGLTVFFSTLIFVLVIVLAVKYRQRPNDPNPDRHKDNAHHDLIEVIWTGIPLCIALGFFFWSAVLFIRMFSAAPENAAQIYVMGKQWMWTFEHANGTRELNELHIPTGQPVHFLMVSQDVIHSMGIPDLRVKQDVMPMRYTSTWFTPTRPGKYHLYCNQYCGNQHSEMVGWVYVMTPKDYASWESGSPIAGALGNDSPADKGRALMQNLGCFSCHRVDASAMAPQLVGLFGSKVHLVGGGIVAADENYIRESVVNPAAKIVAGFQNIMPVFQGRLSEDDLLNIVAYIKSLGEKK